MQLLVLLVLFLFFNPWSDGQVQESAGRHPRSYLLVEDTLVSIYRVKVAFESADDSVPGIPALKDYEYLAELVDGRIGLTLPPEDARAVITIVPESDAYEATVPYVIHNGDAYSKIYRSVKNYFDTHCFRLRLKPPEHP